MVPIIHSTGGGTGSLEAICYKPLTSHPEKTETRRGKKGGPHEHLRQWGEQCDIQVSLCQGFPRLSATYLCSCGEKRLESDQTKPLSCNRPKVLRKQSLQDLSLRTCPSSLPHSAPATLLSPCVAQSQGSALIILSI